MKYQGVCATRCIGVARPHVLESPPNAQQQAHAFKEGDYTNPCVGAAFRFCVKRNCSEQHHFLAPRMKKTRVSVPANQKRCGDGYFTILLRCSTDPADAQGCQYFPHEADWQGLASDPVKNQVVRRKKSAGRERLKADVPWNHPHPNQRFSCWRALPELHFVVRRGGIPRVLSIIASRHG